MNNDKAQLQIFKEERLDFKRTPFFAALKRHIYFVQNITNHDVPRSGWMRVSLDDRIYINPNARANAATWEHFVSLCLTHLAFGHIQQKQPFKLWSLACDLVAWRFLEDLGIGAYPNAHELPATLPSRNPEAVFEWLKRQKIPNEWWLVSPAGPDTTTLVPPTENSDAKKQHEKWQKLFLEAISDSLANTIEHAATGKSHDASKPLSSFQRARRWIISNYPLLGGICSGLEWIEDRHFCEQFGISVAAVDIENKKLFVNPRSHLSEEEARFVLAHELLHAGLRHDTRGNGRDHFLWNVACDFVINGWLIEMQIGKMPEIGALFEQEFIGLSAEAIYDRIVGDLRRFRKLATFRGPGLSDVMTGTGIISTDHVGLDEFYRRTLAQGLIIHRSTNRGLLPAALEEEILARSHPPIPWDVELATWLDKTLMPPERTRTFARASRRQSSAPDIPLPARTRPQEQRFSRTFCVILDTSGSMSRKSLGLAMGAIASYCESRNVKQVRLIYCDAGVYDQGYLDPGEFTGRVTVKGRGGTKLQPAINHINAATDFPADGPILLITDGLCDRVAINRRHAFLMPTGTSLPFFPVGNVFWMER